MNPGAPSAPTERPASGLYLHIPFCATVCPYCDFAVRTGGEARRARWVETFLREIELATHDPAWAEFDSVYFGGGTPSLLASEQIGAILAALRAHFAFASDTRIFLEANPEDASLETLHSLRTLGVGTLSLGTQSFDDTRLRFLGRRHSSKQAQDAVERALAAGFPTVSIDLIYGLPDESADHLERDLAVAMALGPQHLSAYQLSMPEGTRFGKRLRRGELTQLPEPEQADAFVQVHERLARGGYSAYEVSNFARTPEHRSRHNRKYWDHTPYLGLGPGAHSFDGRRRWWNERRTDDYEARLARGERPIAGRETLTPDDLALESLMLGLRTVEGVALSLCDPREAERMVADKLVAIEHNRLRCTLAGWSAADALAARLARPASVLRGPRQG